MKNRKLILIISFVLVIGFASISTNLFLNGTFSIGSEALENVIYFDSVKTSNLSDGSNAVFLETISDGEFTFALNEETDYLKIMYTIANRQIQYGTVAHVECTGDLYSVINYSEDLYIDPQTKNTGFFSLSKDNDLSEVITCTLTYALTEYDQEIENKMYKFELYDDQGEVGKIDSGDQIKLGTEYFYVYDIDNNKLKLISKYNLNNVDYLFQDRNGDENFLSFNDISSNLKLYEDKLHEMGLRESVSLDLITKDQIETFVVAPNYFTSSVYWTKSSYDENSNWYMSNNKNFDNSLKTAAVAGIRPTMVIDNPFVNETYADTKIINDVNNLVLAASDYYNNNSISTLTAVPYQNSANLLNVNYNGTSGNVYIKPDGRVAFQGSNDNLQCVVKRYDSNDIEIFDNTNNICEKPIYKNLVKNGYGEYGDATNFSGMYYNELDNTFCTSISYQTIQRIEIDPSKEYLYQIEMKSNNIDARNYIGFYEYDIDNNFIWDSYISYIYGTTTRLVRDLNPGDTIVYLEDISNWYTSSDTPYYQLGFIFWNYKDSTGYQYPIETYSRNFYDSLYSHGSLDKVNNTITLNNPWAGEKIPAGTYLSRSSRGSNCNYSISSGGIATDYSIYTVTITGNTGYENSFSKFRYGTKYIIPFGWVNDNNVADANFDFKYFIFEEIDE